MMSVILISEKQLIIDHLFNRLGANWDIYLRSLDELRATNGDEWFTFEYDENLISLYEDEEKAVVARFGQFTYFYHLTYSSNKAANVAIMAIEPPGPLLVDNDHGTVATLEDIRQAIASGVAWHMRRGSTDG